MSENQLNQAKKDDLRDPAKPNPVVKFFREVKEELFKVEWPSRKAVIRGTIVVIALSLVIAAFLGTFDYLFTFILERALEIF